MSATAGIIGKGTTLGFGVVASGTYVTIAEVVDVKAPEISVARVDFTNYESPNSTIETLPSGWLEVGDTDVDLTYTHAQKAALDAIIGVLKDFKITLPNTKTIVFTGFISKAGVEIPLKDRIKAPYTVSATTKPIYT